MHHFGRCRIMIEGAPETAALLSAPWEPAAYFDLGRPSVTFRLADDETTAFIFTPGRAKATRWSVNLNRFGVVLEGEADTLADALREVTTCIEAAQRSEVDRIEEGAGA